MEVVEFIDAIKTAGTGKTLRVFIQPLCIPSVDLHTPGVGAGVISTGIRRLCKSLQAKPNREE